MSQKKLSPEDRLDHIYRLIALVFLGVGAIHLVGALMYVLPQEGLFSQVATWIRLAVVVVVPVLCGLAIWKSLSFKRACAGCSLMGKDGFVFGAIQKSVVRAAILGWLALVLMHVVADDPALPAKFFLKIALAIPTLMFSVSFLVSSHVDAERE